MTVEARESEAKITYNVTEIAIGDTFDINFKFLNNDENIRVFVRNSSDEAEELKLDVDYSLLLSEGTNGIWGSIEIKAAREDLRSLTISRSIEISQNTAFNSQTVFASTTEDSLDKLTMILQDNQLLKRCLHVAVDDIIGDGDLELPLSRDATGVVYRDELGKFHIGSYEEASNALRQEKGEITDNTFELKLSDRINKALTFDDNGHVKFVNANYIVPYVAGENVAIEDNGSGEKVISAVDTRYTGGDNVTISSTNVISAVDTKYTAGKNIEISESNAISTLSYVAGENITITDKQSDVVLVDYGSNKVQVIKKVRDIRGLGLLDAKNLVDAVDRAPSVVKAGVPKDEAEGLKAQLESVGATVEIRGSQAISDKVITAVDTKYTGGDNVTISSTNVISAVDTKYTAGKNIEISESNAISTPSYVAGENVTITENESGDRVITSSGIDTKYTAGKNIEISEDLVISTPSYVAGENISIAENESGDRVVTGELKPATTTTLGSIIVGDNLIIDEKGRLSVRLYHWAKSSELPVSREWSSVCFGAGKYVAVSENDDVYSAIYSTDGINWKTAELPKNIKWTSVCYGNGKFVAVGKNSTAVYSTDGITWAESTLPLVAWWHAVCYGNGIFVAVGEDSISAYSTDGVHWTKSTTPVFEENKDCYSVCYGDGKFVAVGTYNAIAFSTDGITWTDAEVLNHHDSLDSVCYGNGKFVAVGSNEIVTYSNDGITWKESKTPFNQMWNSVCYGDGKFVAITHSIDAMYSTDGITWTKSTMSNYSWWHSVCYGNGKFVAVAKGGSMYTAYSLDGWIG